MRLFRMFGRGIRDAFKSVLRNFSLSLASISCISITLIVVSLALVASLNVKNVSKDIEGDLTIVVLMKLNTSDDSLRTFESSLQSLDNVASYEFKSIEDRKEQLIAEEEYWKTVIETLNDDDNIFHSSYLVKVKDITKIEDTVDVITKMTDVQSAKYGKGIVEQMITAFDLIEKIVIVVVAILVVVTVFLIVNTIKLTIFSRRREISIMRVVGASNMSIKLPFVVEGMIIGFVGSFVPILITVYGYVALYNHFDGQLITPMFKMIQPQPFVFLISGVMVVLGILVGMYGSSRAVRKFLKV